ncbi:hypothetical protein SCHPADRAFT_242793 [Schizopora paradoxa]|uniref:Uncharacterized protein n=1 Tax=Schizopora paradoxa TaxID=27342 RepID=A0A0H2SFU9_9AGAM|nr:hypothetical protein SCHPADRAFT_242793 [Schizopora paradoxa]
MPKASFHLDYYNPLRATRATLTSVKYLRLDGRNLQLIKPIISPIIKDSERKHEKNQLPMEMARSVLRAVVLHKSKTGKRIQPSFFGIFTEKKKEEKNWGRTLFLSKAMPCRCYLSTCPTPVAGSINFVSYQKPEDNGTKAKRRRYLDLAKMTTEVDPISCCEFYDYGCKLSSPNPKVTKV